MKLYTFFRSSASFRVRIALNLKGIAWESVAVNLPKGEHVEAKFKAINPQGLVPALDDGGKLLSQSLAIMEYLDETHPGAKLLAGGHTLIPLLKLRLAAPSALIDIGRIAELRGVTVKDGGRQQGAGGRAAGLDRQPRQHRRPDAERLHLPLCV